ncbi:dCTP deaminase domain-containing protein [Enterococcus cecorum]|uniref:Deoxycytidine deaminase n=1 Tax=Enterococcus cecorum TaxID=44008 RepID=A0A0I9WH28_9ENTE|nr:hypothetical protein [Enterococcus cecorum]KLO64797.1 hypothetical protein AA986_09830 [Enterococcus cecorum]KLO69628.1 hypothetical protein AA987_08330 [Enterococcus cecorum]KLO72207.1 hypothetical protein AA989_09135 [Enterococcus cecorum]OUQ09754.1 hypothetical protein B5E88_08895 [Enterococcus cecorum]CAI3315426.1 deoxycytidine triphosphate deaminase [Enterococcus cecorum]
MILTGKEIFNSQKNGSITIKPFMEEQINPNSYNYCLGRFLIEFDGNNVKKKIDLLDYNDGYVLKKNKFYLGQTYEKIGSSKYAMSLIGRSSIGRYGLFLQVSADLGHTESFHNWTLEMVPCIDIKVFYKMKIGQVSFWTNVGEIEPTIHYYNQFNLPTESRG